MEFDIACALELNGEYDLALKRYKMSGLSGENPRHTARVLCKMGRHSESFEQYGKYCKTEMERRDMPNDYRRFEILYDRIMCHDIITDSRKFRPFATFHDFYEFMETENKKVHKYGEVMGILRDIDSSVEGHMARHNE